MSKYSVTPRLVIVDNAIAVDLRYVGALQATVPNAHMIIIWRAEGFDDEDLAAAERIVDRWMDRYHPCHEKYSRKSINFSLLSWADMDSGRFVDELRAWDAWVVKGELEDLAKVVAEQMGGFNSDLPFVVKLHDKDQ